MKKRDKSTQVKVKKPKVPLRVRLDHVNIFKHWYLGGVSVKHSIFRVKGALQTLLILLIILGIAYAMAAFYTQSGEFVISLDKKMASDGFVISETPDFSEKLITLHGDVVEAAYNIDISDISADVMDIDGSHNGINYLAYTFYLKNETGETRDYQYQLNLKKSTKGSEKAAWIMVYKNNEMNLYAMKNSDGTPEKIYSYSEYPFLEYTADAGEYIKEAGDGRYELTARPFISKTAVCTGYREGIKDEEVDKYTVVIWIEGDDPDCTDDIIGGTIEFGMTFNY